MTEYKIDEEERRESWKLLKDRVCNISGKHNVALFVDFPNLHMHGKRNGEYFDASVLLRMASRYGNLVTSKLYTTLPVGERLFADLLKFEKMGFEVVIRPVSREATDNSKDIDTFLVTGVFDTLYGADVDIIIIASDDSDFVPVIRHVRKVGKVAVAFVCTIYGSRAVSRAATTADLIPYFKVNPDEERDRLPLGIIQEVA